MRVLLAVMAVGLAACSSGRGNDADGTDLGALPAGADLAGVALALSVVSPNGLWDFDLAREGSTPMGVPDEVLHFVDGDASVVVRTVTWTRGFGTRFAGSSDVASDGRPAIFNEPGSHAYECRRELLVALGADHGIAVFGTGVDDETLQTFADASAVDGDGLRVAPPSGWALRGALRTGWLTSRHGSRTYSDIGEGWAVLVTPAQQDALASLLCTDLTPVHTGISGQTLVDMTRYERHDTSVDGEAVTVGMLDKTIVVAIAPGDPGRALLWAACCGEVEPPFSPAGFARLVADVEVVPEPELTRRRSAIIDGLIAASRESWTRTLAEREAQVFAEGRDDDAAWIATSLYTPVAERPDHPYLCMVTVRTANGFTPHPPNEHEPECLSAGRATGTLVPGVHASGDHVWGVVRPDVVEIEVEVDGVRHRVEAISTGLPSMPKVFYASIPDRQVDTDHRTSRRSFRDGPITLRAVGADGELAELDWGSEACPINLPEACEPLP